MTSTATPDKSKYSKLTGNKAEGAVKKLPVGRDHFEYRLLLALEASGDAVSVALLNDGGCVAFKQHHARFGHGEYLVDMVQGLMEEAEASFSDLTHIAAGCGPGSFTGLRVCLSAAKGYMLATTATALGVNGLAALAVDSVIQGQTEQRQSGPHLCFADTRRNSLFVQEFGPQANMLSPVRDVPLKRITSYIEEACLRFDGLSLTLTGHVTDLADLVSTEKRIFCQPRSVDAQMIGRYALQSLSSPHLYPCSGFEPLYVVAPKLGLAKRQV